LSLEGKHLDRRLRVLAVVPYPTLGASPRLRVEQYIPSLRTDGIDVTVSPFFDDAAFRSLYLPGRYVTKALGVIRGALRRGWDIARAGRYDIVLVHRESAPIGPPLFERSLAARRIPYLFDFDDAIFLRAIHPSNRSFGWLRRTNAVEVARRAALVIAGNEYLAEWARAHNPNVIALTTPVDTDRHTGRDADRPDGPLVIGWVGSSSTAPFLHLVDDALTRLAAVHRIVVRVIGATYAHPVVPVECIPYALADEPEQLRGFDVGILPEPNDNWTRGKGAFKGMLYMAAEVPVVASRVGVNEEVIDGGGICVDDEDGWVEALDRLLSDAALRHSMGATGRARIVERYSLRVLAPRFIAALRAVPK
jgi:glycosyltransferase involved in cell wall biosynthesis